MKTQGIKDDVCNVILGCVRGSVGYAIYLSVDSVLRYAAGDATDIRVLTLICLDVDQAIDSLNDNTFSS